VAAGHGGRRALIHESPVTGSRSTWTYEELRDEVARTAGMLTRLGVAAGDRVVIYMPMVPEAVFGMLACARIGAIHSVVFGGFASRELAGRIDHAKQAMCNSERPLCEIALDCGLYDQAHFTRMFRRLVGETPCAWRRAQMNHPRQAGALHTCGTTQPPGYTVDSCPRGATVRST